MIFRTFLVLHEAIVGGQSLFVVCRLCGVSCGSRTGEASDGETAAVNAGAVVRHGDYCRVVRGEPRRLRVVRDREYCNGDLGPRGGTRRNDFERRTGPRAAGASNSFGGTHRSRRGRNRLRSRERFRRRGAPRRGAFTRLSSDAAARKKRAARLSIQARTGGGG